ncbi:hypothetical protein [Vibrio sp. Hal054]|uniref:hypothetical protein n=1 Tax=Vibrio sp. Hal054 TaxID=3035158 RepID=UPI00301CB221
MNEAEFDYGKLFHSHEEKPDYKDKKNPFSEFEMGFRKVRVNKSGAGFVKAGTVKYSRSGLEKHIGKWVFVWVDHYYGVTAKVGCDWLNQDLSNRITGVTCNKLQEG